MLAGLAQLKRTSVASLATPNADDPVPLSPNYLAFTRRAPRVALSLRHLLVRDVLVLRVAVAPPHYLIFKWLLLLLPERAMFEREEANKVPRLRSITAYFTLSL